MDVSITHISTACVLLEIGTVRILTDPIFNCGEEEFRVAPGVYFRRKRGPSLEASAVGPLDAVLLSHPHHADNLDESGRAVLDGAREVIAPFEELDKLPDRRVTGLRAWSKTTIFGCNGEEITVTGTPALHGPRWLPNAHFEFDATHVRGYILEWEGQEHGPLYISGDTIYHKELAEIARRKIGTALLHLGGANFWPPAPPFIRYTFTAKQAARFARELGPSLKQVIPVHYEQEVWSHFKQDVATYDRAFLQAGLDDKLKWLPHGECTRIEV